MPGGVGSGCRHAIWTSAADRQVTHLDDEPASVAEARDEGLGLFERDLPGPTAARAVKMTVLAVRQHVVLLAPVMAMAVADEPEFLEHAERPVHGRWDGRGVDGAAALDQLTPGDMPARSRQDLDQGSTLRRPALAAGAELIAHGLPRRPNLAWLSRHGPPIMTPNRTLMQLQRVAGTMPKC
jgi:hypothetical protein